MGAFAICTTSCNDLKAHGKVRSHPRASCYRRLHLQHRPREQTHSVSRPEHGGCDEIYDKERTLQLGRYDLFPMYTTGKTTLGSVLVKLLILDVIVGRTAFLLAANVILGIHDETS